MDGWSLCTSWKSAMPSIGSMRRSVIMMSTPATRPHDFERGVAVACGIDLVLVCFQQTLEQQENPRLVIN